jgi:hypothetical protein
MMVQVQRLSAAFCKSASLTVMDLRGNEGGPVGIGRLEKKRRDVTWPGIA